MDVLKVSSKSNPNAVAGALAGAIREKGVAEIQAIGAGAVNQAIKAIAIARGYVAPSGIDLVCIPAFTDVTIDGEERTAIKLIVKAPKRLRKRKPAREEQAFSFCLFPRNRRVSFLFFSSGESNGG